jgi:hypothetical protein
MTATTRLLLCACLAASAGCGSTARQIRRLEFDRLTRQVDTCNGLIAYLGVTPNPDAYSDASVFLPVKTLNELFDGASGTSAPLPGAGATLSVRKIQLDLACGAPTFRVTAVARKGELEVEMEISALVDDITPDAADPERAELRFLLLDVKPRASWGPFSFRLRGFVRDLLELKLAEYAAALPSLTVPLRWNSTYALPDAQVKVEFPVPSGTIRARVATPGASGTLALKVKRVVYLKDGIHAYFDVAF